MTELIDENLLVHRVEPRLNLIEQRRIGFFGQVALVLRDWDFDGELLGKGEVNGEERTSLVPVFLARSPRARGFGKGRKVKRRKRFSHGCVTHSHGPFVNLTATALRPS